MMSLFLRYFLIPFSRKLLAIILVKRFLIPEITFSQWAESKNVLSGIKKFSSMIPTARNRITLAYHTLILIINQRSVN